VSDPAAGGTGDAGGASSTPTAPGANFTPPGVIGAADVPTNPTPTDQPKLSQAEVDEILGRRTAEAKRQAARDLTRDLGFDKLDDLKNLVKEAQDARKAAMSETDRIKAEAEADRLQARADREAAAQERLSLSVERALTSAGAQGDLGLLARMVVVEPGSDPAAVEAAVAQVKDKVPALFGTATPPLPSTQGVGGGSPGRTTPPNVNPLAVGAEKAKAYEERHQRTGF
jgi:hypothetical protein